MPLRVIAHPVDQDEVFIPKNMTPRARAILEETVEAFKTGRIANIAARYLRENYGGEDTAQ